MKLSLCFFVLFLSFSCVNNADVQQAEALKKEVFQIHDDVMPKTMKVEDFQESIRIKITKNAALKTQGIALNAAMQAASDSMYVWMNQLSNIDALDLEAKTKFLEAQKIKGQTIKAATLKSIAEAEAFLK